MRAVYRSRSTKRALFPAAVCGTGLSLVSELPWAGAAVAEPWPRVTRTAAAGPARCLCSRGRRSIPATARTGTERNRCRRGSCPWFPTPGGCSGWRPAPGHARCSSLLQRSGMQRTHRGAFAAGFGWHTAPGRGRAIGALWPEAAAPRTCEVRTPLSAPRAGPPALPHGRAGPQRERAAPAAGR